MTQSEVNRMIIKLKKAGDHESANLINDLWDMLSEKPEDIKRCWMDVARRAQSVCNKNRGPGIVTIRAGVFGNEALAWEATCKTYDTMGEHTEVNPQIVGTMIALLNGD